MDNPQQGEQTCAVCGAVVKDQEELAQHAVSAHGAAGHFHDHDHGTEQHSHEDKQRGNQ